MTSRQAAVIACMAGALLMHAADDPKPSPFGYRSATRPVETRVKPQTPPKDARPDAQSSVAEAAKPADSQLVAAAKSDQPIEDVGTAYYFVSRPHRVTASGGTVDDAQLAAAHSSLPMGSRVRITELANGRSVVVTITDRARAASDRIIGVTRQAAEQLGFLSAGTAKVRIELVATQVASF